MICVIQRVSSSKVSVDDMVVGEIAIGFNILLAVVKGDTPEDADKLVNKLAFLRVFSDENSKMNLSVQDVKGSALIISQFTLGGSINKGRRPSFDQAEEPIQAKILYELFCDKLSEYIPVETGVFAANMQVDICNDGPVTFIINSKDLK